MKCQLCGAPAEISYDTFIEEMGMSVTYHYCKKCYNAVRLADLLLILFTAIVLLVGIVILTTQKD
jgi:hypothetical protein